MPAPAPAHEQRRAQLPLQRAHLLGDRGLAERERRGGARERALTGDLPEGEQPARIEHPFSLSVWQNHYLRLWTSGPILWPMDPIHITFARDASRRALLGARLDDPVVPDSPSLLTRARRALARTRWRRPADRRAAAVKRPVRHLP